MLLLRLRGAGLEGDEALGKRSCYPPRCQVDVTADASGSQPGTTGKFRDDGKLDDAFDGEVTSLNQDIHRSIVLDGHIGCGDEDSGGDKIAAVTD